MWCFHILHIHHHTDVPLEMMQSAHLYDQTYVVLSYIPSSSCYRRIHWDAPRCLLSQSATCGTISWSLFIMSQAFPLRSSKLLVFKIQYIWCYLSLHAQQGLTISTETLLYSPPSPLHHHSTTPPLPSIPSPPLTHYSNSPPWPASSSADQGGASSSACPPQLRSRWRQAALEPPPAGRCACLSRRAEGAPLPLEATKTLS